MTRVAVFDYGAGNIFSLRHSLEREGASVDVIRSLADLGGHAGLLLPGVGHFDPAVRRMKGEPLADLIGETVVLGICLGMEVLFEKSQEGSESGLGVLPGDVVALPGTLKTPHMGWNSLEVRRPGRLLEGIDDGSWVYFVHSYRARPASDRMVTAEADYGVMIPAVIEQGGLFGTQFHPEKSGSVGRQIMRNFLRACAK